MISMSQTYSIRQMRKNGESISEIARKTGVSRNTVYAKLAISDLSPRMPVKRGKAKTLDRYRGVIESWLDEDAANWRKQRHTARRIWQRLRDEHGVECCESTVRHYVRDLKALRKAVSESYLDLVWRPGEAQADFGEADFCVMGTRRRLSFFVLSFPYSNMGFAQLFPSENAECVCQALKQVFGFTGGVPSRIVFDNATGVGRRACGGVRTTETFTAFAAHYGFAYSFCNPNSGHEKGNVEGKVKSMRSNLFVPVPRLQNMGRYNARLLGKCAGLAKEHYIKGVPENKLFAEDKAAMLGLPETSFNVVRYMTARADKQGKVQVDGRHFYSTDPALAGAEVIVALGATTVDVFTTDGELVCTHERRYGSAPTDSTNPASQLPLLAVKLGAWANSQVRASIPDSLREYMDSQGKRDLAGSLRIMRDQVEASGWDAAVDAMEVALESTGRVGAASVAVAAARSVGGALTYDEPVDLAAYDEAIRKAVPPCPSGPRATPRRCAGWRAACTFPTTPSTGFSPKPTPPSSGGLSG